MFGPESDSKSVDFINELNKQRDLQQSVDTLSNDPNVKLRKLQGTISDGMNCCYNKILTKVCQQSLPEINGRVLVIPDLDKVVADFVARRTGGKDATFYVKEAIRKNPGNIALRNMAECVEKAVKEEYEDKLLNPSSITPEDYSFTMTPKIDERMDEIIKDNELDSLAEVIRDNVKQVAVDEAELAKKDHEERKSLEDELMNDPEITSEAALESALARRMVNQKQFYQPSLFNGVLISEFNKMDSTPVPFAESVDMQFVTEGFFDKLKANFAEKKARDAKEAIALNGPAFSATCRECYQQALNAYQASVASLNVDKLVKEFEAAMKSGQKLTVKLPDVASYVGTITTFKDRVKKEISTRNFVKEKVPKYAFKTYSAEEALSQFKSSVAVLDKAFHSPDRDGFVEKYARSATTATNRQVDAKNVGAAYRAMTNLVLASAAAWIIHADFCDLFATYAKKLIHHTNGDTVKEAAFDRAVTEFTLLNMSKAMRLEPFDLQTIKQTAMEYAQN